MEVFDISTDSNGNIYAGNSPFVAIDQNGGKKWSLSLYESGGNISKPVISKDGTVYVIDSLQTLYAIDKNGTEKWHTILPNDPGCYPQVLENGPAIGDDRTIYIVSGMNLYAVGD